MRPARAPALAVFAATLAACATHIPSTLDAPLRDSFMALLLGETRAAGTTLVFVSHDDRLAAHFDRPQTGRQLGREVDLHGAQVGTAPVDLGRQGARGVHDDQVTLVQEVGQRPEV